MIIVEIIIDRDYVIIEGEMVRRPQRIAPSAWLEFWEKAIDKEKES